FGEIESVKATSDLYTGVSGTVVAVNEALLDDPAVINEDPHDAGWLIRVQMDDPTQLDELLDGEAYNAKYPG
ncbi:MAG: glycine cleavage system protein H, partial [Desulfobacterales bacterium]|nr:glycine cleavage system protein H [Desulfobacterales bacterium]